MNLFNDVMAEHREIKQVISGVMKKKERLQQEEERLQQEKERLQQEKEKLLHEHLENGEALAQMKEELLSSKNTLVEARDALVSSAELISQKNNDMEFLKKKLQESEANNNQTGKQGCTNPIEPGEVQTRSSQKRKRLSEGPLDSNTNEPTSHPLEDRSLSPLELLQHPNVPTRSMETKRRSSERTLGNAHPTARQASGVLLCDDDDVEAIRDELIKGFLEIDYGRRKLGIKEMGELSEKAFETACRIKVPPEEVGAAFEQLYSSWQQHLGDLSWYPFKSVTVDGNCQEIVNLDDDKLQELKRVWGQGAHDAVITALVEMKEYGRLSDRSIAYELWNFKEGRKATTRECVQYLFDQVKRHSATKRRNTLRSSGRA